MSRPLLVALIAAASFAGPAACTRQVQRARPSADVSVSGYPSYPVAVGSKIHVKTSWSGRCEYREPAVFTSAKVQQSDCDEKEYSLLVECRDATQPTTPPTPCQIRERSGRVHLNRLAIPEARGNRFFDVRLFGQGQVSVIVTLRRGSETRVHESPRFVLTVPDDFLVDCEYERTGRMGEGTGRKVTVPCEGGIAAGALMPEVVVRSRTTAHLADVRVNGVPVGEDSRIGFSRVTPKDFPLDRVPAGDYPLVVEVNPPPYTIRRELVVRVR